MCVALMVGGVLRSGVVCVCLVVEECSLLIGCGVCMCVPSGGGVFSADRVWCVYVCA